MDTGISNTVPVQVVLFIKSGEKKKHIAMGFDAPVAVAEQYIFRMIVKGEP